MRPSAVASSLMSLAVGLLAGCPDRSIDQVNPLQGRVEAKDIPVNINRDLDLLFLIDDSPSMADKQANLAANFPNFINVLGSIPGGLPNVHIGVTTSDLGTQGALDSQPGGTIGIIGKGGCSGVGKNGNLQTFNVPTTELNGLYISDIADPVTGVRTRNYNGDLSTVFGDLAKGAGAGGCGFEQHLEAVKKALQPSNPANQGFVRPDAYLGVIIIADEDDCSLAHASLLTNDTSQLGPQQSFRCTRYGVLCDQNGQTTDTMNQVGPKGQCHPNDDSQYLTKINDYVTFLKGLKSDPKRVIVAGIMGTTDPFAVELRTPLGDTTAVPALAHSCTYVGGDGKPEVADPPIRMKFFLDQFPNRSTFVQICQRDLSGGLAQIGDLLKTVIGDPCIEGHLADVDPSTPGAQYECSVSYVVNPGVAGAQETIMPKCSPESDAATNKPCWHIAVDAVSCPASPGNLVLKIEGEDQLKAISNDVHVLANCVTQPE